PRSVAESAVASMWTEKDPAAATKWLATLPDNEQNDLVGTIVRTWANNNWTETSRWIETLSGTVRDYAISNAMNREGANENDSLKPALSNRNYKPRQSKIEGVVRNWSYSDPEAAESWVKNSPLSSEQREQLLSVIARSKPAAASEATDER